MKGHLNILFAVFMIALCIPAIHNLVGVLNPKPLHGAFVPAENPEFSIQNWMSGEFQDKAETFLNENLALKPFFVRLNNQIDYSFFSLTNAEDVVIGKNSYLFEENYIDAYTGRDFVGVEKIELFINQFLEAKRILNDRGVELIFVFAPGKATFFPEYIPDKYLDDISEKTNYGLLSERLSELNAGILDFNRWFVEMKDTVSYPLFPKAGIHWSYYGMYLVADSIVKEIEARLNLDLPDMYLADLEIDKEQRHADYDLGDLMNLLFKIPAYEMAYPVVGYQHENKTRPSVLAIGDSFYWNIYYSGIPANVFESLEFWYYNSSYYNDGTDVPAAVVRDLDFASEVFTKDVILVIQTDGGLDNFGFGFFNDVILNEDSSVLEYYKNRIRNSPEWMEHIKEKAIENDISVEEMLTIDAKYIMQEENR